MIDQNYSLKTIIQMSLVLRLSTESSRPYLGEMTIKKYINQHSSNCKMETQMSSSMTMDYTWKISKMGLAIWRSGYSLCSPWMDEKSQWYMPLVLSQKDERKKKEKKKKKKRVLSQQAKTEKIRISLI